MKREGEGREPPEGLWPLSCYEREAGASGCTCQACEPFSSLKHKLRRRRTSLVLQEGWRRGSLLHLAPAGQGEPGFPQDLGSKNRCFTTSSSPTADGSPTELPGRWGQPATLWPQGRDLGEEGLWGTRETEPEAKQKGKWEVPSKGPQTSQVGLISAKLKGCQASQPGRVWVGWGLPRSQCDVVDSA